MATDTQTHDQAAETAAIMQRLSITIAEQRRALTGEAPRLMRAEGSDWDHEVRVALPDSYHLTKQSYPVLWVTDVFLELAAAALGPLTMTKIIPEHIIVNVGPAPSATLLEWAQQRTFDFSPDAEIAYDGP